MMSLILKSHCLFLFTFLVLDLSMAFLLPWTKSTSRNTIEVHILSAKITTPFLSSGISIGNAGRSDLKLFITVAAGTVSLPVTFLVGYNIELMTTKQ